MIYKNLDFITNNKNKVNSHKNSKNNTVNTEIFTSNLEHNSIIIDSQDNLKKIPLMDNLKSIEKIILGIKSHYIKEEHLFHVEKYLCNVNDLLNTEINEHFFIFLNKISWSDVTISRNGDFTTKTFLKINSNCYQYVLNISIKNYQTYQKI